MRVLNVVGARPNFVKIAPLMKEYGRHRDIEALLVHTGQHYDNAMSDQFFSELDIPQPHFNLGVGSGSHAVQTAGVMTRLDPILGEVAPDVVVVVGDVNSTLAAALTAVKRSIPVAHVEAGLRSFDRTMPEEINRLVTDAVADLLFVTEPSGRQNLRREGIPSERIHLVGNVMIDALLLSRSRWERSPVFDQLGLQPEQEYVVVTLHRPSNVDDAGRLRAFAGALADLARHVRVVFPTHPRVGDRLKQMGLEGCPNVMLVSPMGYLDFIALLSRARLVVTDSGGVQEESTALGVECLTVRDNTERPITVTHGTNRVIGSDPDRIVQEAGRALTRGVARRGRPPRWDGKASERIVNILRNTFAIERADARSRGRANVPRTERQAPLRVGGPA